MKRFIFDVVNAWTRLRPAEVEEDADEEADGHPPDVPADAPPAPDPTPRPAPDPTPRGPRGTQSASRLDVDFAGHMMVPINPNPGQTRPFRKCHVCHSKGIRKESQFVCPVCQIMPMCLYPCYFEHHSKR